MENYVDRKLAELAKAAGFDMPCSAYYSENTRLHANKDNHNLNSHHYISAPLYQELWFWLNSLGIFVQVAPTVRGEKYSKWDWGYMIYPSENPHNILAINLNLRDLNFAWIEGLIAALNLFKGYVPSNGKFNLTELLEHIEFVKKSEE